MTWDQFKAEALSVLLPIFLVAVSLLAKFGIDALRVWLDSIKQRLAKSLEKEDAEIAGLILDQVTELADGIVAYLEQRYVDPWKQDAQNGKLTALQVNEIQSMALGLLKGSLAPGIVERLRTVTPDVEEYLKRKLEERLVDLKTRLFVDVLPLPPIQ